MKHGMGIDSIGSMCLDAAMETISVLERSQRLVYVYIEVEEIRRLFHFISF